MKKAISSLLLSTMMLASIQPLETHAAAAAQLSTKTELLAVPEIVDGQTVPAGTLKVSLVIANNPGFGLSGIKIPFDANKLEAITATGSKYSPLKSMGPASENLMVTASVNYNAPSPEKINNKNGIIGFGTISTTGNKTNGVICSVYLKAKKNVNLSNESIKNIVTNPVVDKFLDPETNLVPHKEQKEIKYVSITPPKKDSYTKKQVVDYTYTVGDVYKDGRIDAADVQAILVMLKDSGVSSKKLNVNNSYDGIEYAAGKAYKGVFFGTSDKAMKVDLAVADVTNDGYVSMDDAAELLDYYADVVISGGKHVSPYKGAPAPGSKKPHYSYEYVIK